MNLEKIIFKKMILIGGGDNLSRGSLAMTIKHSIQQNSIILNSLDYMDSLRTFAYNLYGISPEHANAKHFSHLIDEPLCEHFLTILKNFHENIPYDIIGLSSFDTFFSNSHGVDLLKKSCISFGADVIFIYINNIDKVESNYHYERHLSKIQNNKNIILLDEIASFDVPQFLNV